MKSFKTLLLLAATLSGLSLAACGVESPDASETRDDSAQQVDSRTVTSESAIGIQCVGTIKCAGPTSTSSAVSVACKWATTTQSSCSAACPKGTAYLSGSCAVVAVDPPPAQP